MMGVYCSLRWTVVHGQSPNETCCSASRSISVTALWTTKWQHRKLNWSTDYTQKEALNWRRQSQYGILQFMCFLGYLNLIRQFLMGKSHLGYVLFTHTHTHTCTYTHCCLSTRQSCCLSSWCCSLLQSISGPPWMLNGLAWRTCREKNKLLHVRCEKCFCFACFTLRADRADVICPHIKMCRFIRDSQVICWTVSNQSSEII